MSCHSIHACLICLLAVPTSTRQRRSTTFAAFSPPALPPSITRATGHFLTCVLLRSGEHARISVVPRTPVLTATYTHSEEFERINEGLSDALDFTRTIGFGSQHASYEQGGGRGVLGEVDFYTR